MRWNLAKEGGWKKYEEITNSYANKLNNIVEDKDSLMEDKYIRFEKVLDKIKFKAFGKVTLSKSKEKEVVEDNASEDERARSLFVEQERKLEKEMNEIKDEKSGKMGRIWKIRKNILGNKKETLQATAIVNPKTKKLEVSKELINTAILC